MGWLASYPKAWKRAAYERKDLASNHDSFRVRPLFGGNPLLTAEFESDAMYQPLSSFPRMKEITELLTPNVIHEKLIGSGFTRKRIRSEFRG